MPSRAVLIVHAVLLVATAGLAAFFVTLGLIALLAGTTDTGSDATVGRGVGILSWAIGLALVLPLVLLGRGLWRYRDRRGNGNLRAADVLIVIVYGSLVVAVGPESLPALVHVPGILAIVALVTVLVAAPVEPPPPLEPADAARSAGRPR